MQWIASLTPEVTSDPLTALKLPPAEADLVEIRLDLFPELDLSAAIGACPLPILATYRSSAEGGAGSLDPETRLRFLRRARDAGPVLIDLEWARDSYLQLDLGLPPEQVVLSWHDGSATPADLMNISFAMLAENAALVKVIPTARCLADLESVLSLYQRLDNPKRLMAFAMGKTGVASRFLAPLLGSPLGFASWCAGASAAPGQLPPDQMNAVVGHLSGPPRKIFGVVGRDVTASLSPALHAAAFRATGLPDLMIPVSVPDANDLEALFQPQGMTLFDRVGLHASGWAVTSPYKAEAASAATFAAPRVRRAGAANTLILKPDALIAENTDADGVVGGLTAAGVSVVGKTALIQGTGGAARGAAIGLHLAGANVLLRSRDDSRAERTAQELDLGWRASDASAQAEILVNATPLGTNEDDRRPFSLSDLDTAEAVVDMVYTTGETLLVSESMARGLKCVDGRRMLAFQGMAQFAAFTATVPPRKEMLAALGLNPAKPEPNLN